MREIQFLPVTIKPGQLMTTTLGSINYVGLRILKCSQFSLLMSAVIDSRLPRRSIISAAENVEKMGKTAPNVSTSRKIHVAHAAFFFSNFHQGPDV